jgi:hypothetical protein
MSNYIFGQGTPWTYDQLQQKRQIAQQLMTNMGAPKNVGEGLNAIGDALLARRINKKAAAEEERMRGEAEALWSQVSGGGNMDAIVSALGNPMIADNPGQRMVLEQQMKQMFAPPPKPPKPIEVGGVLLDPVTFEPIFDSRTNDQDMPNEVQLYEYYAEQERAAGREPLPFGEYRIMDEKAAAGDGSPPADEEELRKKLGGAEGDQWAAVLNQGRVAASTMADLQLLDELATMAPQGPITGRLAGAFPGVNSAADAFQSIVKRVAPTMRAEGSGSTSDIEYAGMLAALPQLAARPEANRAIIEMMRAKAQVDQERAGIVAQYQNNEISATDARRAMTELDQRSIMTPELQAVFGALAPQGEEQAAPEGGELSDEELIQRYLEQNGG